jgi:hypothetical protein
VHQQRRIKPVDLSQIFFSFAAVISDRGVHAIAHRREESHQPAEAVAEDCNRASAPRQLGHGVGGVLNVSGAGVSVIALIRSKTVLPVGLGGDAEVDARLLTPQ